MDATDSHARKKPKVECSATKSLSPLNPLSYTSEKRDSLRDAFLAAKPFPHLALSDLCDDAFLRTVRDEIIAELKADYKETDIFKVLQTGDLANLGQSNVKIRSLLQLRDGIYSEEFRSFVQLVTGCPPLTEQVDCSCNIYPESGHLLCHDDVIGSRCVSYIIYLTDPEETWAASDGGALELYPIGDDNGKARVQTQEVDFAGMESDGVVLCGAGGWFHTPSEHVKISKSSLQQLQNQGGRPHPHFSLKPEIQGDCLDQNDVDYLKEWVNPLFLGEENIEKIYKTFQEEGSIQLRDFLNETTVKKISTAIAAVDPEFAVDEMHLPVGWNVKGPPHKQRYLRLDETQGAACSADLTAGALLNRIEKQLFQSDAFHHLLHQLTGITSAGGNSEVRCFRPGSDYTIALYNRQKQETLDAVLCFVHSPDEDKEMAWDSGEVGGFEAYLLADTKEETAADVYRADDDGSGVLSVSAVCNTLNLVLSDEDLMKFVKYVSRAAPGCRWDISAEYLLVDAASPGAASGE